MQDTQYTLDFKIQMLHAATELHYKRHICVGDETASMLMMRNFTVN